MSVEKLDDEDDNREEARRSALRLGCLFSESKDHQKKFGHRIPRAVRMGVTRIGPDGSPVLDLPTEVDLSADFPPVTTQLYECCTSECLTAAFSYAMKIQRIPTVELSRLFLYYQERVIERTTHIDAGAQIYSGVLALMTSGICEESVWPYNSGIATKPDKTVVDQALKRTVVSALLVDSSLDTIRATLAERVPIVCGIVVYPSFGDDSVEKTGDIQMPNERELRRPSIGGHAIVLVGYNDATSRFIFRNSWGEEWGNSGHGTLPYDYVTDEELCRDLWIIRLVRDATYTPTAVLNSSSSSFSERLGHVARALKVGDKASSRPSSGVHSPREEKVRTVLSSEEDNPAAESKPLRYASARPEFPGYHVEESVSYSSPSSRPPLSRTVRRVVVGPEAAESGLLRSAGISPGRRSSQTRWFREQFTQTEEEKPT